MGCRCSLRGESGPSLEVVDGSKNNWEDSVYGNKTRICSWFAWVDRWFGREMEVHTVIYTEFHFSLGCNKNEVV